jgi:hypothetical protein
MALVIVVVLAVYVVPAIKFRQVHGLRLTTALSNGRQIHQAVYRMVLDGAATEPPSLEWPGDIAAAKTSPVTTSGQLVERLVELKYFERGSVAKLFVAPGRPVYPGTGPFEGKYSPYFFFKVTEKDDDTAIFLATKNFHYGAALDPKGPWGEEGCVIVRKAGDALMLTSGQAMNKNIGVMPGGTKANPGEQAGNTLND